MSEIKFTEATMLDLLAAQYPDGRNNPRHLIAFHVNNRAGFSFGRTLDAVIFDTWPSGGLTLHGIEVKVSAGDLRRELQDTRKAHDFTHYLDYFSIAAAPGIVGKSEIPDKWGLMVAKDDGSGIRCVRKPLMLHDGSRAETVDRSFAAALCRAFLVRSCSAAALKKAEEKGRAEGEAAGARAAAGLKRDAENALAAVETLKATGIYLHGWMGESEVARLKTAIDYLDAVDVHGVAGVRRVRETADRLIKEIGEGST